MQVDYMPFDPTVKRTEGTIRGPDGNVFKVRALVSVVFLFVPVCSCFVLDHVCPTPPVPAGMRVLLLDGCHPVPSGACIRSPPFAPPHCAVLLLPPHPLIMHERM